MTQQTTIIAEMAYSHDGSVDLAINIAEKAAQAGADALSIHITYMPDYMVRHYGSGPGRVSAGKDTKPIYDYLCEISLSFDDWIKVAEATKAKGLDLVIMPNDLASLEFAETLGPAAYVLSAACFDDADFVGKVGQRRRDVYLRVGGATLGEIETVINALNVAQVPSITLLYGHQNYPTGIEHTNLRFLTCLKETFGLPVGIADHVDADDDFAGIAPLLALPLGISCIEKHLTHDRGKRGEDFESAMNVDELTLLVERVRKAETAMGGRFAVDLDESSATYRKNVRKRLVAACDIAAGEAFSADNLISKRSDEGVSPSLREAFIGRKAAKVVAKDDGLTFDLIAGDA